MVAATFPRLVFYAPRSRYFGIPEGCTGCHEERIVDVARICEDDEVEAEQPGLFSGEDAEVWGMEGRVGECLVENCGHIILEIVECRWGEVGVCGWRTIFGYSVTFDPGTTEKDHEPRNRAHNPPPVHALLVDTLYFKL